MSKSKQQKALPAPKEYNTWVVTKDGVDQKHRWNSEKAIVEKQLLNSPSWIPAYPEQVKYNASKKKGKNYPYTSSGKGKKWVSTYKPSPYKGPLCVFCDILYDVKPSKMAHIEYDVACFKNKLEWAREMLLVVPTVHMTQEEAWTDEVFLKMTKVAIEMGKEYCPEGFLLVSNFGYGAHQTVKHSHIHIVAGNDPFLEQKAKWTMVSTPETAITMEELWTSDEILDVSKRTIDAVRKQYGEHEDFRLVANYWPEMYADGGGAPDLYVHGGKIGMYV